MSLRQFGAVAEPNKSWISAARNSLSSGIKAIPQTIGWAAKNPGIALGNIAGVGTKGNVIATGVISAGTAVMRSGDDVIQNYNSYGDRVNALGQGLQDIGGGLYNMDASRLASGVGNTIYSTVVGGLGTAMDPAGAAQALKVRLGLNKNERENLKNTMAEKQKHDEAQSLMNSEEANSDIEGLKGDDRTWWQRNMSTYIGGKEKKELNTIQSPEINAQLVRRRNFDAMSDNQREAFIGGLIRQEGNSSDNYNQNSNFENALNQLRPDQQEKFKEIAQKLRQQAKAPEEGAGQFEATDTSSGDF